MGTHLYLRKGDTPLSNRNVSAGQRNVPVLGIVSEGIRNVPNLDKNPAKRDFYRYTVTNCTGIGITHKNSS